MWPSCVEVFFEDSKNLSFKLTGNLYVKIIILHINKYPFYLWDIKPEVKTFSRLKMLWTAL